MNSPPVNIRVRVHEEELVFAFKSKSQLMTIFEGIANRQNVDFSNLRLYMDGERINSAQCIANYCFDEGDVIEVFGEQEGGGLGDDDDVPDAPITLRVKDQGGEEMFFKVKRTTKMQKILEAYAGRRGVQSNSLRFMFDGVRIVPDTTPKMMEMEDNDQIDVFLESVGGGDNEEEQEKHMKNDNQLIHNNTTTNCIIYITYVHALLREITPLLSIWQRFSRRRCCRHCRSGSID